MATIWTKFTARAQRAIFFAQQEAEWRGDTQVTPDDLLLGVIRNPTSAAQDILDALNVSSDDIRRLVKERRASTVNAGKEITLAPTSKMVIDEAFSEVRHLKNPNVTTHHLFLGLVATPNTVASDVLSELGVTQEAARSVTPTYVEQLTIEEDKANEGVWPPPIKPAPIGHEVEVATPEPALNGPWYLALMGFIVGMAIGYIVPVFYVIFVAVTLAIIIRRQPQYYQFLATLVFGALIGGFLPGSWIPIFPYR